MGAIGTIVAVAAGALARRSVLGLALASSAVRLPRHHTTTTTTMVTPIPTTMDTRIMAPTMDIRTVMGIKATQGEPRIAWP
jgi:hypothetical protein